MERLGLEEGEEILPGIVIQADGGVTGNFRILCDGDHDAELEEAEEEVVDAVATTPVGIRAPTTSRTERRPRSSHMDAIFTRIESPIGRLTLTGDGEALTGLYMEIHRGGPGPVRRAPAATTTPSPTSASSSTPTSPASCARSTCRSRPRARAWQLRVWDALQEIPYGETVSYGEIARRVGAARRASRAVGTANGSQPDLDHRAVPPRHRRQRQAHGLRRRPGPQAVPARPRAR